MGLAIPHGLVKHPGLSWYHLEGVSVFSELSRNKVVVVYFGGRRCFGQRSER